MNRRIYFKSIVMSAAIVACLAGHVYAGEPAIDTGLARQYFAEAETLSVRDNGALWSTLLYGPMMFVDPQTRMVVANQADSAHALTMHDGVAVGALPTAVNVANTSMNWSGVHWTMLLWPLPADRETRDVLMMHELWHRVQDQIGYPATNPSNAHLDTPSGRTWMQLEWRAVEAALRASDSARVYALNDALIFRAVRRTEFPQAAEDERALEMHEGLAEYTGVELGIPTPQRRLAYVENALAHAPERPSFVRSFAYVTGPAYGLLLDAADKGWLNSLVPTSDLGVVAAYDYGVGLPDNLDSAAVAAANRYGGDSIRVAENTRAADQQARIDVYRARLVDGPVLILPFRQMNMSFDPGMVQPLGDAGTVYPTIRLSDDWGVLDVTDGGALLSSDFSRAFVSPPSDTTARPMAGNGWTLKLNDGWTVAPGTRSGDYTLVGP